MADGTDDTTPAASDGADDTTPPAADGAAVELAPGTPGRRRRRRALWGVLAVLAVGGGALAVVAADDDPPRLPIALGDGGAERGTAADMAMLAWVEYVAGDDLPLLGAGGPAYRVSGEVGRADIERLADLLDVDGRPTHDQGTWTVQDADGDVVQAYEGYGGSWWYSRESGGVSGGGSAGSSGTADCPPDARECSVSSDDVVATTIYEPPPPPADLPTRAEAERIARELFEATGVDLDGAAVVVDGPYDGWYVTLEPTVDGRPQVGLHHNAVIGPKGAITSASGVLHTPERLGRYPTIDTRTAIDRLNQGVAFGGGRESLAVDDATTTDQVSASGDATTTVPASSSGSASAGDGAEPAVGAAPPDCSSVAVDPRASPDTTVPPDTPVSSDEPTVGCTSPEPYPTPTGPTRIVLHQAEEILILVPASDGSSDSYLVPGYRMTGDDGSTVDVPAVDDDSLLPVDADGSGGGSSGGGGVEPAPHPATDPGIEPATGCAQPEPGPDGAVPDICLDPKEVPPAEPSVGEG